MDAGTTLGLRTGRELSGVLRGYAVERRWRSRAEVALTLVPMLACLVLAGWVSWWPWRLAFSVLGGMFMVRAFILFHDFMHGALLRDSVTARVVMYVTGALLVTPPRSWRESHNYHHANVGKVGAVYDDNAPVVTTDIGAFPVMTTGMWRRATWMQRARYVLARHPMTMFCAYLTVFMVNICLGSFFRDPRKHWPSALVFIAHVALLAGLWLVGGWRTVLFAYLLPLWLAAAMGALLFYIQHSFPGVRVFPPGEWEFTRAALETASYLKTGRVVEWFTGCIGYHQVHHLNSGIPFYRLREAMASVPELQHPVTVRLRDIGRCFRANLWDPDAGRMVDYPRG